MWTTPIYSSLHKPNHFMGAEKRPVMMCAILSIIVAYSSFNIVGISAGIIFWLLSIFVLRRIAKADPLMCVLFIKHTNQQKIYLAKTNKWRSLNA